MKFMQTEKKQLLSSRELFLLCTTLNCR